jgi:ribosomal protein S18 acetylase RimI-like enzyme
MVPDRELTYRAARLEDAPELAALVARCDATYSEWAPPSWVAPGPDEEDAARLAQRIADPGHVVTVAVADGAIAGFMTVRPSDRPGRGRLSNLFVDPSSWGRGIGRGLLARAVEAMRERGFGVAELSTQVANARARGLYEGAGWRDTGRRHLHERDGLELAEYELELT